MLEVAGSNPAGPTIISDIPKDTTWQRYAGKLSLASLSKLPDEKVIQVLCEQDGIGRWTAEMFLIFTLGREDIMPAGDLGVRKGVKMLYSLSEMPTEKRVLEIAEKWRPYRTAATWYLWECQR